MARIKISQLEESETAGDTIVTVNGESKKYNLATLETAVGQLASDHMTLSTAQNVSGVKNFQNGFNVGNANVVYDNTINALVLRNDAQIYGDVNVDGVVNRTKTITDDNVLVIDVAKEINIDTTGVKLEIPIPSGYVGNPTARGSDATVVIDTYTYGGIPAVTNSATVKVSSTNATTNTVISQISNVGVMSSQTFPLVPFCKDKITAEVTTAPSGATFKAIVYTRVYCRKQ